jgi:hypothetical protein
MESYGGAKGERCLKTSTTAKEGKVDIHTLHTYNEKTRDRLSVFKSEIRSITSQRRKRIEIFRIHAANKVVLTWARKSM